MIASDGLWKYTTPARICEVVRRTDIDPLPYNLLFERFLNPERVSMPDIDIDFCTRGRGEVIKYVTEKYGREQVAQIITFGTLGARAAIKDVGRVMDMSFADVDKLTKLVPTQPLNIKLKQGCMRQINPCSGKPTNCPACMR